MLIARWEARDQLFPSRAIGAPISHFREKGIPDHLLWMLYQAHVEHLRPCAAGDGVGVLSTAAGTLQMTVQSAFSLTAQGEAFATQFLAAALQPDREGALKRLGTR